MVSEDNCPYCGYDATEHESLDGDRSPIEGDFSICFKCGEASRFLNEGVEKVDMDSLTHKEKEVIREVREYWVMNRKMFELVTRRKEKDGNNSL